MVQIFITIGKSFLAMYTCAYLHLSFQPGQSSLLYGGSQLSSLENQTESLL